MNAAVATHPEPVVADTMNMSRTPDTPPPIILGTPIPYPNVSLARPTGQILFFDEADSLFGKRTEVRSNWRP